LGVLLGCTPGVFFWVVADMTSFGDTQGCAQALVQAMGYRLSPVETLCRGTICHTIAAAASRNAAARQR
jgi:hypothetical protein